MVKNENILKRKPINLWACIVASVAIACAVAVGIILLFKLRNCGGEDYIFEDLKSDDVLTCTVVADSTHSKTHVLTESETEELIKILCTLKVDERRNLTDEEFVTAYQNDITTYALFTLMLRNFTTIEIIEAGENMIQVKSDGNSNDKIASGVYVVKKDEIGRLADFSDYFADLQNQNGI